MTSAGCARSPTLPAPDEQGPQVHDPDDIVEIATMHRRPRVSGGHQPRDGGVDRFVVCERDDLGTRQEDLAQGAVGELEGSADDRALLLGQLRLDRDHVPQLLLGHVLAVHRRVAPEQPDHQIGGAAEQPHRRTGDGRERGERTGGEQPPALRPLHGHSLGSQLPDHQRHECQHHRHEHDRGRTRGPAQGREDLDERLGEGNRRRRRGEEPGQGDPDLDRGEEPVRVLRQAGQRSASSSTARQPSKLPLPQADQRDLTAGEGSVDQDKRCNQRQLAPDGIHERSSFSSQRCISAAPNRDDRPGFCGP
jgi:hypothetical protein